MVVKVKTLRFHDRSNLQKLEDRTTEMPDRGKRITTCLRPVGGEVKMVENFSAEEYMGKGDSMYNKSTLENGIRVVTKTMPELRSISMGVLINASLRNETPNKSGLAHLVEHVMFSGTSSRNSTQIAQFMDEAGGHMGAFTARDYTCYFATVLDDYRTYALDLLGDILLNSIFPSDNLEKEKSAILREINTESDMPGQRAHALLRAQAWPDHPLGRSIGGRPETIKGLTRENVIYFVHEHYLPDRFIIAAAGNLEHEDFVAQVRDAFWRMMGQSQPAVETPPVYQSGAIIEHMPVSQTYFSLGIRAFPYANPDRYRLHVLNNVLGGGISSRLFRRIRMEQGLAYQIGSEYHAYYDDGMLVVEGCTAPENFLQVLDLAMDELWKLFNANELLNEEELWKAKMQIRGQHLISGENTNTQMSRVATQELYFGGHIPDEEILAQIESINIQTLQRFAGDALRDSLSQATVAVVGPEAADHYNTSQIAELFSAYHRKRKEGR